MKVYLAGPMTGVQHFNFPAFHAAAAKLRADGYTVFSPAEDDLEKYGQDFATSNPEGSEAKASVCVLFRRRASLRRGAG